MSSTGTWRTGTCTPAATPSTSPSMRAVTGRPRPTSELSAPTAPVRWSWRHWRRGAATRRSPKRAPAPPLTLQVAAPTPYADVRGVDGNRVFGGADVGISRFRLAPDDLLAAATFD